MQTYTAMLHTHKLVVILFLLLYLIKTILLLADQKDILAKVTRVTKVPEMIISTLFLVTGGYLLFNKPELNTFIWIKLVAVFASIPLAVIGFKKSNKILAALSLLLIVAAYGLAEMSKRRVEKKEITVVEGQTDVVAQGKAVFMAYCVACHGENGQLGIAGAKDLSITTLSDDELKNVILNGKNAMSPYKNVLETQQVTAVTAYVKSLKK